MKINGKRIHPKHEHWLTHIYRSGMATIKQVAFAEGITVQAVSKRIRTIERTYGTTLPRLDRRGRKPLPVTTAA